MNNRCAWWSRNTDRVCDKPCEGRYCEHHARVAAVRDAGAELRAAREAVARAKDAVVEAAKAWQVDNAYESLSLSMRIDELRRTEVREAEARARLEAL